MKPKAEWEKELHDLIRDFRYDGTFSIDEEVDVLTRFIRSHRSQLLKSLKREVNSISFNDENCEVDGCHFEAAIDDVLSLLAKYETK
jgi:hypothetical protein